MTIKILNKLISKISESPIIPLNTNCIINNIVEYIQDMNYLINGLKSDNNQFNQNFIEIMTKMILVGFGLEYVEFLFHIVDKGYYVEFHPGDFDADEVLNTFDTTLNSVEKMKIYDIIGDNNYSTTVRESFKTNPTMVDSLVRLVIDAQLYIRTEESDDIISKDRFRDRDTDYDPDLNYLINGFKSDNTYYNQNFIEILVRVIVVGFGREFLAFLFEIVNEGFFIEFDHGTYNNNKVLDAFDKSLQIEEKMKAVSIIGDDMFNYFIIRSFDDQMVLITSLVRLIIDTHMYIKIADSDVKYNEMFR